MNLTIFSLSLKKYTYFSLKTHAYNSATWPLVSYFLPDSLLLAIWLRKIH